MNVSGSERPRLDGRARVAVSETVRIAIDEDVEAVEAVERTSLDLGPAARADVALVAEGALEEIAEKWGEA